MFGKEYESIQCTHGLVTLKTTGKQFYLTAVYGLHTMEDRKILWQELRMLNSLCHKVLGLQCY